MLLCSREPVSPVRTLFEYLERGYSIEEFLECFPSVTKDMVCRLLERED